MSVGNPNDDSLRAQIDEIRELLRARPLQATSVKAGRTRFYGGSELLIEDSNLNVTGTASIVGWLRVVGRIVLEGLGILTVNGLIELLGRMRVNGGGGITVEDGGDIDVLGGMIRAGLVRMEDGKLWIGDVVLDPSANGGSLKFPGGPEVYADGTTLALYSVGTGAYIEVGADELKVRGPGINGITVNADGLQIDGARPELSTDEVVGWYGKHADGYLVLVSPSVGGPLGDLSWPFPPSMVTSEYGPREAPGEGASTFHEGLDFGAAEGTPIPSAGPGVVEFAGENGGFGNCVVINHGSGVKTRYAHMQTLPAVSVGQTIARSQILGPVGNTGVSFGPHLHFEVEVNGAKVNPRTKLPPA